MGRRHRQGFDRQLSRRTLEGDDALQRRLVELERFLTKIDLAEAVRRAEKGPHLCSEVLEPFSRGAMLAGLDPALRERLASYIPRHLLYCEDCSHIHRELCKAATEDD